MQNVLDEHGKIVGKVDSEFQTGSIYAYAMFFRMAQYVLCKFTSQQNLHFHNTRGKN